MTISGAGATLSQEAAIVDQLGQANALHGCRAEVQETFDEAIERFDQLLRVSWREES